MPEVKFKADKRNFSFAKCPLCSTDTRIARDASAWILHMVNVHDATVETFTDGSSGAAQAFSEGLIDSNHILYKFPYKCYGCGASFSTAALLVTHLEDEHINVFGV